MSQVLSIEALNRTLAQRSSAAKAHRVFSMLKTLDDLRLFMQWHVFAVWDFMSLVRRLERDLMCVSVPWLPTRNSAAARLINETTEHQESDGGLESQCANHFELYLASMRELGADSTAITQFVDRMRMGGPVDAALSFAGVNDGVRVFVKSTLDVAKHGSVEDVAGNFLGREEAVTSMFSHVLSRCRFDIAVAPSFAGYLERHISTDMQLHGPAAGRLAVRLTRKTPNAHERMLLAAIKAVEQRVRLWDALAEALYEQRTGIPLQASESRVHISEPDRVN
jgi:hypothetical protein